MAADDTLLRIQVHELRAMLRRLAAAADGVINYPCVQAEFELRAATLDAHMLLAATGGVVHVGRADEDATRYWLGVVLARDDLPTEVRAILGKLTEGVPV